jgi:hypothetical protein
MTDSEKLVKSRQVYKVPAKTSPKKSLLKTSASKKKGLKKHVTFDEYEYVTPARHKLEPKKRTPTPAKKKGKGKGRKK